MVLGHRKGSFETPGGIDPSVDNHCIKGHKLADKLHELTI